MDQVRPLAAAAPAPPPKRHWLRISLAITAVEAPPAKLFSVDRGPYSLRFNVALTRRILRVVGIWLLCALSVSHPVVWRLVLQIAHSLAQQ